MLFVRFFAWVKTNLKEGTDTVNKKTVIYIYIYVYNIVYGVFFLGCALISELNLGRYGQGEWGGR